MMFDWKDTFNIFDHEVGEGEQLRESSQPGPPEVSRPFPWRMVHGAAAASHQLL